MFRGRYCTIMARNSWGATRELPSGRWQASYLGPDKQRYKAPDTFRDRLDALAWLAAVRKEIDLGAWEPPVVKKAQTKIPTVGEMVRHWLALTKPQVRDSTYKAYEEIVTARVLGNETLCAIPVDKLTPVAVAAWWQETVQAFPASNHRNARAYHKLRAAIALAVEYGYLPTNPVAINAARTRAKSKAKELPTTAELRAILDNVPERYRLITVLCLFHGLRIGEALAVKNKNFEFDTNGASVRVEGNLVRVPNGDGGVKMALHPPKTNAGYRTVPLLREFVPVVIRHLKTFATHPEEYATLTKAGAVVFDTSYRSVFNRAKQRAGIDKPITPHYGRNFIITRLAEAGATPREIGRILGQEDVSTIVNIYMKSREARPVELMRRVDLDD